MFWAYLKLMFVGIRCICYKVMMPRNELFVPKSQVEGGIVMSLGVGFQFLGILS